MSQYNVTHLKLFKPILCHFFFNCLINAFFNLTDPDKARGCSTNSVVPPLPPLAVQRRQAHTAKDAAFSHEIDYVAQV